MNVLIIGGYGTFGYGIADLVSDEPELTITIAGRNFVKAKAACESLSGAATFIPLKLDRNGDLSAQIETPPDIIIDTSGPFQNYGDGKQDHVIQYALAYGCHYLDICDDLEFVDSIRQFDSAANKHSRRHCAFPKSRNGTQCYCRYRRLCRKETSGYFARRRIHKNSRPDRNTPGNHLRARAKTSAKYSLLSR